MLAIVILCALYYFGPLAVNKIARVYNTTMYEKRIASRKDSPAFTYYISSTGNDGQDGKTLATAWRTIKKVNATEFNPGDSILFEGNKIFMGNLQFDAHDVGTPEKPVILSSFGTGRAIIDAGNGIGIKVLNTQGYHISNINVKGDGFNKNEGSGIAVINDLRGNIKLPYIMIDSVDASGFGYWGLLIDGNKNKSGFSNVKIQYCDVHSNGDAGLYVYGEYNLFTAAYAHANVYIANVKAFDNPGRANSGVNTGSGIVLSDTDKGLIEKCLAYNNGEFCHSKQGGPVGIWAWDSRNVIIQYNESYNNKTGSAKDGGGFDLDGGMTNSILQYNYSHDNEGAGFFLAQFSYARKHSENILRYNITYNDGRKNNYAGIEVWGSCENAYIYNNTVYMDATPGSNSAALIVRANDELGDFLKKVPSKITVSNNIFVSVGSDTLVRVTDALPSIRLINNNYYNFKRAVKFLWNDKLYADLIQWRNASTQEKEGATNYGFSIDPGLNVGSTDSAQFFKTGGLNQFQLKSGSKMIDASMDVLKVVANNPAFKDILGSKVPQHKKADIGACEFTGSIN